MSLTAREKALRQVRQLLRVAEDQADLPEGKTAQAIADDRLQALGMTADEVREVTDPPERLVVDMDGSYWQVLLLAAISDFYDCSAGHNQALKRSRVYGTPKMLRLVHDGFLWARDLFRSFYSAWLKEMQEEVRTSPYRLKMPRETMEDVCRTATAVLATILIRRRALKADDYRALDKIVAERLVEEPTGESEERFALESSPPTPPDDPSPSRALTPVTDQEKRELARVQASTATDPLPRFNTAPKFRWVEWAAQSMHRQTWEHGESAVSEACYDPFGSPYTPQRRGFY